MHFIEDNNRDITLVYAGEVRVSGEKCVSRDSVLQG
jgi:hypothetical protein